MIVRDEVAIIERCIESARPLIDRWVICDTGSNDGTPEHIEALLGGLPGRVVHDAWSDFGTNRNRLLSLANETASSDQHLLLLDADMTIDFDEDALDSLDSDGYHVQVLSSPTYWMPYIVRSGLPWRYVGTTHEYLMCEAPVSFERLPGLRFRHHGDGGSRGDKFVRDFDLLTAAECDDPNDPRTAFYLAQTLRDLGRTEEAAAKYLRRAELGGWDEEVFCAFLEAGRLLAPSDWDRAVAAFLAAHNSRPGRPEPLFELARGFRIRGMHHVAYLFSRQGVALARTDDLLFVDEWIDAWGMRFEHSITAWWAGFPDDALACCDELLARDDLPPEYEAATVANRAHCIRSIGIDLEPRG